MCLSKTILFEKKSGRIFTTQLRSIFGSFVFNFNIFKNLNFLGFKLKPKIPFCQFTNHQNITM